MDIQKYQKILENIKTKAPIESGVQTLVYMLLEEIVSGSGYDVVVIDNLRKKSIYATLSGISDLAIVKKEFDYNQKNINDILFCIEVKAINDKNLNKHENQLLGHLLTFEKALITNGIKWRYYDLKKIKEDNLNEITTQVKKVIDDERDLSILNMSYANIQISAIEELQDWFNKPVWEIDLYKNNNNVNNEEYMNLMVNLYNIFLEN